MCERIDKILCERIDIPLVVDLDGTLLRTDMLHETFLRCIVEDVRILFKIPSYLSLGKAHLKRQLAILGSFDPQTLPYSEKFLEYLREQHQQGRKLILCTASDQIVAQKIADYLGIFEQVVASDANVNLKGELKAKYLVERFGEGGFDYAGNSKDDIFVWEKASHIVIVNPSFTCLKLVQQFDKGIKEKIVFEKESFSIRQYLKLVRVHQWLKNILLFIPFIVSNNFSFDKIYLLFLAFFAFSFCASAVYLINDLLDIENDRHHPSKCRRPFAAGTISIFFGIINIPILLFLSLVLASFVGETFLMVLGVYFFITTLYSFYFKSVLLLDCIILSMLYTFRIIGGGVASSNFPTLYLLSISFFLFFSLAIIKRYVELANTIKQNQKSINGRAYIKEDITILKLFGVSSGYCAVLLLAPYLNSVAQKNLYPSPSILGLALPVMLYWISWMWLQALRGNLLEDPIEYATKDRASQICFASLMLIFFLSNVI